MSERLKAVTHDAHWAVVDVETTGFSREDRIVEFGCVLLDVDGCVVREYETLIHPLRHPGPVDVHGISPRMIATAPTFPQVASEIAAFLNGKIVVAHNITFDWRMLEQEMGRIEGAVLKRGVGVCTYRLTGKKLDVAARGVGWEFSGVSHAALEDARATAHILATHSDRLASLKPQPAVCTVPTDISVGKSLDRAASLMV